MSFVLLDDHTATLEEPRSRLYTRWAEEIVCEDRRDLRDACAKLEQRLNQGLRSVMLCDYEFGEQLTGLDQRKGLSGSGLRFLIFEQLQFLSSREAKQWLDDQAEASSPSGIIDLAPNVGREEFGAAIRKIKTHIAAGETYQVNYTYRLKFSVFGAPIALYRRLRSRQPAAYGAFILLPDGATILSFSPELFISQVNGRMTAKPIKGTCSRSGESAIDALRAKEMVADPKISSENLMIVDLLRNDLGKVAQSGSVKVSRLFEVEHFGAMLQVVSTIECDRRAESSLADILEGLFPCGSITGAPKRRTMQIIQSLEPEARGLYTGAIGWMERASSHTPLKQGSEGDQRGNCPDFVCSVAIRTLALGPPKENGLRSGVMGVGAGILYDSDIDQEYAECQLKARFLTELDPGFALIETMYATRREGCRRIDRHLKRLQESAVRFRFGFDQDRIFSEVERTIAAMEDKDTPHRIRLLLRHDGESEISADQIRSTPSPVRVVMAEPRVHSSDPFLRHKTTVRSRFDTVLRRAERLGAFDALFLNEHGQLTEGARCNVFVKLSGHWYTPPLAAGLLPGIMRSVLLEDPELNAGERQITLNDLGTAEEVMVCNSLRGAMKAVLER